MFRDQRDFRAIAFQAATLKTTGEVLALLPKPATSDPEQLETSTAAFELVHCFYYSSTAFVQGELLDRAREKGRRGLFRYNMYLLRFPWKRDNVMLVAVPFFPMAVEVFSSLHKASRGLGLKYHAVDLSVLISTLASSKGSGNSPRLTAAKFAVEGDSPVNTLSISGDDVLNSRIYKRASTALSGITLKPRRCRILYDDHEGARFGIHADYLGNYWFSVRKYAVNLIWSQHVWKFLYSHGLVTASPAFPLRKGEFEDEDEDE